VGAAAAAPAARPRRAARGTPRARTGAPGGRRRAIAVTGTGVPSPRRARRRGEGAQLRAEILAAAERLLLRTGDRDAVSIRAVADAVGVTPPSIYLHFADKGELLYEVCQRHFRALDERMLAAGAQADDPLESLLRRGLAYVRFGLENPEHYRILFMARSDELPGRADDELEDSASFEHMVEAVHRCMDADLMRREDPRTVTIGLWATAHGLTSLFIAKPNFPWPDRLALAEQVLTAHCQGLLAEEGDPGG